MSFIAVVVPTIRKDCIERFLKEWSQEFTTQNVRVYIIEDNPDITFDVGERSFRYAHYSWREIDKDLGGYSWIIPRKTDCVRSYGYWKAYQDGASHIITLDDDCYPPTQLQYEGREEHQPYGVIAKHIEQLTTPAKENIWRSTIEGLRPRGIPYKNITKARQVMISHGLWLNVPDLDALTQLTRSDSSYVYDFIQQIVPLGYYYPMCGMNVAFTREVVPAMYFLLMGKGYVYDRFGDIWAGIFTKKIVDHLGHAVVSGLPVIWHERASDPWKNLDKEKPGYHVNESLWEIVDKAYLRGTTYSACYKELAMHLDKSLSGKYWNLTTAAMVSWLELFE